MVPFREHFRNALVGVVVTALVGIMALATGVGPLGAFVIALIVGVGGLTLMEVRQRRPLANRRMRRRERAAGSSAALRRAAAAGDVVDRIGRLRTIHNEGDALIHDHPTEERVTTWLDQALNPLVKPERWTVLHAPPVHSETEEPNAVKRRLEDLVQGLQDVIDNQESLLYGLKGPKR